jgi:RNA polymerase sigma-70 factor, ECF subfamily
LRFRRVVRLERRADPGRRLSAAGREMPMNNRTGGGVQEMSMPSDSLLNSAQRGDMAAFAELFEALRPAVHRTVCRLAAPDDVDDVVMEVFLKAWQAIPRFRRGATVSTWLYRIAHNCCMDARRRQQRRRESVLSEMVEEDEPLPDIPDERQRAPDQVLADAELAAKVRGAVQGLPAEYRSTLLLRYADGLSYAEIAAATGVSIGTVMSRLFYGKRKLKKVLVASQIEDVL